MRSLNSPSTILFVIASVVGFFGARMICTPIRADTAKDRITRVEERLHDLSAKVDSVATAIGYKDHHDSTTPHETIEKSLQEIESDIRRIDAGYSDREFFQ